jgi:Fe-S-cluster-containing dehydrogenase component
MRPVMVLNARKCIGCRACVAACSVENGVMFAAAQPAQRGWPVDVHLRTWVSWREKEGRESEDLARQFTPALCQHCEDAPCVNVCPTGASFHSEEGVVLVDKEKCIGCSYCIVACPYGMRYRPEPAKDRRARNEPLVREAQQGAAYGGVMFAPAVSNEWAATPDAVDKCTFCYHRNTGEGLWQPACVEVCPTEARLFGDLDDPNDPVAEKVRTGKARPARADQGTKGRVYYEV